jgi:hypothetical protein
MRVGCGSAAIGMFAQQWFRHLDEVVVVDDHITGVLSEHQAGKLLDVPPTGIRIRGHRSTPGRYFRVAAPGQGWGGTDITDPLSIIDRFDPKAARPGLRMLMVSTTGDHAAYFELDDELRPVARDMPEPVAASVARVQENCEPAMCSVVFIGGAGGSLRSGVTENPVRLTRSVRETLTHVTSGGAQVYLWPGGGITYMVDVMQMPENSFGYVPTPALVAPIEFTMRLADYEALGGHMGSVRALEEVTGAAPEGLRRLARGMDPAQLAGAAAPLRMDGPVTGAGPFHRRLADGRLHLQHGPIDMIIGVDGAPEAVAAAEARAVAFFDGLLPQLVAELPALRRPVGRGLHLQRPGRAGDGAGGAGASAGLRHADGGGGGRGGRGGAGGHDRRTRPPARLREQRRRHRPLPRSRRRALPAGRGRGPRRPGLPGADRDRTREPLARGGDKRREGAQPFARHRRQRHGPRP